MTAVVCEGDIRLACTDNHFSKLPMSLMAEQQPDESSMLAATSLCTLFIETQFHSAYTAQNVLADFQDSESLVWQLYLQIVLPWQMHL